MSQTINETDDNMSIATTETEMTMSTTSNSCFDYDKWEITLTHQQYAELEKEIFDMIDDYLKYDMTIMSSPIVNELIVDNVAGWMGETLKELEKYHYTDDDYAELCEMVKRATTIYFENNPDIPPRSYNESIILQKPNFEKIEKLTSQLNKLRSVTQPQQKTKEWYECRHNLMTASNMWKIFKSESQRNSFIYEKCKPINTDETFVNVNSSMHWGVKYEPVSVMLYENKFNTKIEEFGCIPHPEHSFIGASPDGINVDLCNDRYGRMIEIKNIVNRDIVSSPKEEYWIQMQIQMETCDLDECDFIETRFKECPDEETFCSNVDKERGIILYFVENEVFNQRNREDVVIYDKPLYKYMPMEIMMNNMMDENTKQNCANEWVQTVVDIMSSTHQLHKIIRWVLDEFSCVLVPRNRLWFKKALPLIKETWDVIEKERTTGFEHRSPKKKVKSHKVNQQLINVVREETDNEAKTYIQNMPDVTCVNVVKLEIDG